MSLTRVRENGESIALLGGEDEERAGLDRALGRRAARVACAARPAHAHHGGVPRQLVDRAGDPDHSGGAQIPRRQHEPGRGHAGGVRLHDRAGRVRLAGRQLSAACRLERRRAPDRVADGVAGRARARRIRRGHRAHPAQRNRRHRGAPARSVGHPRRRHRGHRSGRGRDRARRAGAGRGRIRHRQEHA